MSYGDGREVLRDVDLTLRPGAFWFLTGAVGAGKTSLLRLLSLSHPPASGGVEVFGRDAATLNREQAAALRQRVGVVFQDFRLLEHLSTFDNVALPLRIAGANDDRVSRFVPEMLQWIGLGEVMEHPPKRLSMGQRQLACIARAVVTRPAVVLADEPTSNIDAKQAERVMNLFMQLNRLGACVVLATHSLSLCRRYPYPILRLEDGRLIEPLGPARRVEPEQAKAPARPPGRAEAERGPRPQPIESS